ncbi:MAG: hypothetical protein AAFP90_10980 [Planctomycetota bacterium]
MPSSNNKALSGLSYNARKALTVHVGESAGEEIANLIQQMAEEIEELKRSKVNVTSIVPAPTAQSHATVFEDPS